MPRVEENEGRAVQNRGGGSVQKQQQPPPPEEKAPQKSEDSILGLRLDLNLDVDIHLTAKIHGDLTLSLL